MLNRAYSVLRNNISLVAAPVVMDLISLLLVLTTVGYFGESKFSLHITLSVGLPTINNILDAVNSISPDLAGGGLSIVVLLFIIFLSSFFEAGFIGQLYQLAAKDSSPTVDTFISYAKRFWLRFLGVQLLLTAVSFVGILLAALAGSFGLLLYIGGFLYLRILFIYWEFTIISQDLDIISALRLSRNLYDVRPGTLNQVIISILVVNLISGLVFNFIPAPLVIFVGIFVYNVITTGLQLALMYTKPNLA